MFSNCSTVGELKTKYVQIASKLDPNHPDLENEKGYMDRYTRDYLAALKALDGQESVGTDGKVRTYNFKVSWEQKIIDKLAEIIAKNPGWWNVEVIGLWIWVSGTEKPDARLLGRGTEDEPGLRMSWNPKRKCWQWKPYPGRARFSKKSKDQIGAQYGQVSIMVGA